MKVARRPSYYSSHHTLPPGTLDAIACESEDAVMALCCEVWRILEPTGVWVCVSHAPPERRLDYFERPESVPQSVGGSGGVAGVDGEAAGDSSETQRGDGADGTTSACEGRGDVGERLRTSWTVTAHPLDVADDNGKYKYAQDKGVCAVVADSICLQFVRLGRSVAIPPYTSRLPRTTTRVCG